MSRYPDPVFDLVNAFKKLPGIGEKTAERLTLYLLKSSEQENLKLARAIAELKKKTKLCTKCFALTDSELCSICSNPDRDGSLVCVVEKPGDMSAIEKSGNYKGLYHVLQGTLSPMEGIGPDNIRVNELLNRVAEDNIKEIIIATGTSIEGETTASYIASRLAFKEDLKISRIASGIPMGGDLKYFDQITLKRALEGRHEFK